jgi:hypothetical protein
MSTDKELDELEADLGRHVEQLARITGKQPADLAAAGESLAGDIEDLKKSVAELDDTASEEGPGHVGLESW